MQEHQPISSDPFQLLGVSPEATDEDVRSAYFQKVKEFPPERDPEGFKRIRKAYDSLRNQEDRILVLLSRYHPPPPLEDIMEVKPAERLPLEFEDLKRILLSVTDLERNSFKSDHTKMEPLIDALLDSLPKEET